MGGCIIEHLAAVYLRVNVFPTVGNKLEFKGPVIIYQLGGWAILGGGMKKILPQMGGGSKFHL